MTLSYTAHLRLAVPDFLSEPWHSEFAAAMDSIDRAMFETVIAQNVALWTNSTVYTIGTVVISPDNGSMYTAAVAHTSSASPTTFTQEQIAHPTFWVAFAPTLATQVEAQAGIENTHYMSPLRVKEAISAQTFATALSTQGQAEAGTDNTTAMTPLRVTQHQSRWGDHVVGRLTLSTATLLKFAPSGGGAIKVNGVIYEIPIAGIVGLANTGVRVNAVAGQNLAANTTYLIACLNIGGVLTAEFSTSIIHAPSTLPSNAGVEVQGGNDAYTVIGMCRTNASAQFQDDIANRQVISWFDRKERGFVGATTGAATTSATGAYTELNVASRANFLTWGDEHVHFGLHGYAFNNTLGPFSDLNLSIDIAASGFQFTNVSFHQAAASYRYSIGAWICRPITEGYHFSMPVGLVTAGTVTATVIGSGSVKG